ncbi:MAG TPA: potassium channel family protein [Jatrophihabitans sp.]|nr:potassium channel family protein [Jatrophihabitans sp.]
MLRAVAATTALVLAYYNLPLQGRFHGSNLAVLLVGIVAFGAVCWLGVRRIIASATPRAVAVQVLAIAFPLFIISFASVYLRLSEQNPASFSAQLTRTDALYFTVTVFSTVGFGDLVPATEVARVLVMFQMLGDLAIIGAGVHVLTGAVRLSFERRGAAAPAGNAVTTANAGTGNADTAANAGEAGSAVSRAGTGQLGDTRPAGRPARSDR